MVAVCWGSAILSIGLVLLAVLLMSMIFLWFWGHETFDLSVETHGSLRDFAPKSCPDDAATSLATFPEQSPIGWHRADSMDGAQHVPECSLLYHGWRSLGCAAWRECFSFQNRDPGHLTTDRQWGHINPEYRCSSYRCSSYRCLAFVCWVVAIHLQLPPHRSHARRCCTGLHHSNTYANLGAESGRGGMGDTGSL